MGAQHPHNFHHRCSSHKALAESKSVLSSTLLYYTYCMVHLCTILFKMYSYLGSSVFFVSAVYICTNLKKNVCSPWYVVAGLLQ